MLVKSMVGRSALQMAWADAVIGFLLQLPKNAAVTTAARPEAALSLLRTVLGRRCFTPLLPKNETLASMGDAEFKAALDKWTVDAKTGSRKC